MTTSSEDVLLQIAEVRYKKGDGTLYIMSTRLAWINENGDKVAVAHRFADIKTQKISPEGKPKVQLQIVLHDGNTTTFHFINRNGQQAMLADRNKVKELLQKLLPNFKRKIDKELEEKNRILASNPNLLQLYKDLVTTKVITSEEFWNTHASDFALKNTKLNQKIGVSADFLTDIKPQMDGCNGLKYNLTPDVVNCIFKTYPAVKQKHLENVPSKMTEGEFWTKFFQSHYFHRDRITTGVKDMFAECGEMDEQVLNADLRKGAGDPLYDLKRFGDVSLDEGFGNIPVEQNKSNSDNMVHQNMIKRFNQHSAMILRTCTNSNTTYGSNAANSSNSSNSSKKTTNKSNTKDNTENCSRDKNNLKKSATATDDGGEENESSENPLKKQRLLSKIYYDDLGKPSLNDGIGFGCDEQGIPFNLVKSERYLQGPMPSIHQELYEDPRRMDDTQNQLLNIIENWMEREPDRELVTSTAAVNALGELSPGGALMRGFGEQASTQMVPPEFEKELRILYLSLAELLRHFWHSFPPSTPELEQKALRMHEALLRFKAAKLIPFEERAIQKLSPLGGTLAQHLHVLLQKADTKFVTWKERKIRQLK